MAMKKCKECGEEISSSAKKCPKCGKDQRNFFMKHPVLYTIIILVVIGIAVGSGNSNNNSSTSTTTTSSTSSTQKEETIYNIGDTITNGDYEITVQAVNEANKVGTQYLNSKPADGGTYVCVDFNYKNISSQPINSWNFPSISLVDSNGVEYSSDISASSYYATEKDPNRKVLSDLNPGITVTDNKVFEISSESYSQGEWYLVVDKNVKIKIK
jgi:hypothetical protein